VANFVVNVGNPDTAPASPLDLEMKFYAVVDAAIDWINRSNASEVAGSGNFFGSRRRSDQRDSGLAAYPALLGIELSQWFVAARRR
jgi:hypothetical protein